MPSRGVAVTVNSRVHPTKSIKFLAVCSIIGQYTPDEGNFGSIPNITANGVCCTDLMLDRQSKATKSPDVGRFSHQYLSQPERRVAYALNPAAAG